MTPVATARIATRGPQRLRGWRAATVWLAVVLDLAAILIAFLLVPDAPDLPLWAEAIEILIVASFGLVGALIVTRQPRNPVGWLLGQFATASAISAVGQNYATLSLRAFDGSLPGTVLLAWFSQLPFMPALLSVVIFVPMLFPDGRLLSRRWRWLIGLEIAAIAVYVLGYSFRPGPLQNNEAITNPLGIDALSGLVAPLTLLDSAVMIGIVFPMAVASVVLRYRRGGAIERQQVRWFAAAAIFTGAWFAAPPVGPIPDIGWALGMISIPFVPIAIAVAISRYRLYEIDRIISRTIAYALVTAILAGVFAAVILVLQWALASITGGGTVAVAASTLAVAATFQPLRRRVRHLVDRRFNRAHIDAERTAGQFAARLRDDVDLESVRTDVLDVIALTVRPVEVGLWIRAPTATASTGPRRSSPARS